jgi:hypothetical protein
MTVKWRKKFPGENFHRPRERVNVEERTLLIVECAIITWKHGWNQGPMKKGKVMLLRRVISSRDIGITVMVDCAMSTKTFSGKFL